MTMAVIIDTLLYEAADIIPNLLLAMIPFLGCLRFSVPKTGGLVLLLYGLVALCRILALNNLFIAASFTVLWIVLYLLFYIICVKAEFAKLLFVLLVLLNYGSFLGILFSYFADHRFPVVSNGFYFLSANFLSQFLLFIISYPLMVWLMYKKVRPLTTLCTGNRFWRYLWLVPGTFCFSYYYNIFTNDGIILYSSELNNVIFASLFNAGAIFVSFLVLKLVEESNSNALLKAENYHLNMQTLQYDSLQNRMEEARQARHDLRQNLAVIQTCLRDKSYDSLEEYVNLYASSLPDSSPIAYCENYALNALIVYYEGIAHTHHIAFHTEAFYPAHTGISDTDTVVLFGNLLENAVEACTRQQYGDRSISMIVKQAGEMYVIILDNTHSETITQNAETFVSSKSGQNGIGTYSIKMITRKYNGTVQYVFDSSTFHASVLLNPNAASLRH